eukprot:scaffold96839_cov54-Phaeocystis_antarctica.AAC.2
MTSAVAKSASTSTAPAMPKSGHDEAGCGCGCEAGFTISACVACCHPPGGSTVASNAVLSATVCVKLALSPGRSWTTCIGSGESVRSSTYRL